MTTADAYAKAPLTPGTFRLPDPPPRHPDDMTSFKHLAATGNVHHLALHLGNPETTIVSGELYMVPRPIRSLAGSHYPDLLVAFDVDPKAFAASNGYIVAEQGKPPDFVLEIASRHTGHIDIGEKRDAYQALGVLEYWRFDETGRYHRTRLAGDRLVAGRYETIGIAELSHDTWQGYSEVLDLHLRWENGQLGWHDPATGGHIATLATERQSRLWAEARANTAEARVAELEAELQRVRNG